MSTLKSQPFSKQEQDELGGKWQQAATLEAPQQQQSAKSNSHSPLFGPSYLPPKNVGNVPQKGGFGVGVGSGKWQSG